MKQQTIFRNGVPLRSVAVADTYFTRLRGLIGRDAESLGGLLIRPCAQIHTCFMQEAIDVLYLDASGKVLRIDENVPASKFFRPVPRAKSVLELPSGCAAKESLRAGDVLTTF